MLKRTSIVDSLKVDSLQYSSIIQLGDSSCIQGGNRALAVQREEEIFFGQEGDFRNYRVFREPIFLPVISETFEMETFHHPAASIKVSHIDILGVSSASIVHIGCSKSVQMESRVKHIRHLLNHRESEKNQDSGELIRVVQVSLIFD